MAKESGESTPEGQDNKIKFDFVKSQAFRVIHADGFFGGVSPNFYIHMAVYNQRNPIPQQVTHKIDPDGSLGAEIKELRVERQGVVREVEADIIMDMPVAEALVEWLRGNIDTMKRISERKSKAKQEP